MTQRLRISLVLSVGMAAMLALTTFADVSVELELVAPVVELGEPFDVTVLLTNTGDADLVTSDEALTVAWVWPYLGLTRLLSDGTEISIVSDRPLLTPLPSSLWVERDGVQVAVRPALRIGPGVSVEVPITNLLRYVPLVDPGDYRLTFSYDVPVYRETFTDPAYGETEFVAVYEAEDTLQAQGSVDFALALSEGLDGTHVEWFRQGREAFLSSRAAEEVVDAFAPPDGSPAYVRACSGYWIGEAFELFWENDRAIEAYESVLSDFADTLFAGYAEDRLEEIRGSDEAP